jgi:hypothetical protein
LIPKSMVRETAPRAGRSQAVREMGYSTRQPMGE